MIRRNLGQIQVSNALFVGFSQRQKREKQTWQHISNSIRTFIMKASHAPGSSDATGSCLEPEIYTKINPPTNKINKNKKKAQRTKKMPLGEHSIERPCECRAAFDDFCFFFNSCFIYFASLLLKSLLQYKIVNASCFLEREKDRQNNSFQVRSSASHNGRIIQLLLLQLLVSCFMTPLDKTNPLFPLLLLSLSLCGSWGTACARDKRIFGNNLFSKIKQEQHAQKYITI